MGLIEKSYFGPSFRAGLRARARGPEGWARFRVLGSNLLFAGLGPSGPVSGTMANRKLTYVSFQCHSAERLWPGWVLQLSVGRLPKGSPDGLLEGFLEA